MLRILNDRSEAEDVHRHRATATLKRTRNCRTRRDAPRRVLQFSEPESGIEFGQFPRHGRAHLRNMAGQRDGGVAEVLADF